MSENVQEIVLTKEIVGAIAQAAADIVKTQLALDERLEIAPDQLGKLADKISTRLDATVDYDKIKSEVKRGLPAPSFKNYELTNQDRYDIAQNVLTGLDLSEDIKDTLARNFVSKAFFNQNIVKLKQFVNDNKGRVINAGIAGKEMIEEINKVLGTDWQGGGAGGDMLKSVYDANDDGKVNEADAADSVPWDGVTGKPAIGDMLKSVYDTNDDGKVNEADAADSVPWTGVTSVPITIDPSGNVTDMGRTEQNGHAYFPTFPANIGLWWSDDGLPTGNFKFAIRANNTGTLLLTGAEGSRVNISSSQFRIITPTANTALYVIGGITTENNLNVQGDAKFKVYTNDVSNPPTDAELDALFGTPAAVGAGFTADIDDAGASNNFYSVKSDGSNWWTTTWTKAI